LLTLSQPSDAAAPAADPGLAVVTRAQQGDSAALAALYDQHYSLIYGYLRARLGDRHAVEDLTGEVFQRMLTGLAAYRPQGLPFRAWLVRIAHNLLVDHYPAPAVDRWWSGTNACRPPAPTPPTRPSTT
jgi:RNA polymerase sigma-70 factor (ECF subfamily)